MAHRTPDLMPLLSPGRHRHARKGACFMEMASFLAGEKWSDHPRCTHPLLAVMARAVNDHVGDDVRQELTPLIPQVIGVVGGGPRVDAQIARQAALTALPLVSASRQRVAAVGILCCEAVLADLDDLPRDHVSPESAKALAEVPDAERWARDFLRMGRGPTKSFTKRSAPTIVHNAVVGISNACVPDSDALLLDLLRRTIADCRVWMPPAEPVRTPVAGSPRVSAQPD